MNENKILEETKQKVDNSKQKDNQSISSPEEKPKIEIKELFNKFKAPIIGIIVLIIIILIILFSTGSSLKNISIFVVDEQDLSLKDALVEININGETESLKTDVFGIAEFTDIKAKEIKVTVTKENYLKSINQLRLNKPTTEETIKLKLDSVKFEFAGGNTEKRREIIFKNFDALINDVLTVTFICSPNTDSPQPKTVTVTNGRQNVVQSKNCEQLFVSVVSNNYELITKKEILEDNIVELKKINSNTGILEVTIKTIQGTAIPGVNLKIHAIDDPLTSINESELIITTGTTDAYGKYKFRLAQSNYLITADKIGYITLPKSGPHTVVNNNLVNTDIILFTVADLENINCSNLIYSSFCSNGQIDCNSSLLTGMVSPNPNGSGCIIGRLSNLTIKLKDQNTSQPIIGNISIYRRDENISSLILTRRDVNQTTFVLLANKNYRIIISNTEKNGYISPNPQDINNLSDGNRTIEIPLAYSSALNSGTIKVNVKKDGHNRANALVYLFYKSDGEHILYNPENPRITNLNGDVNFNLVRSNRYYYAYAILRNENADGDSLPSTKLDSNETAELGIILRSQLRALNLKITPNQDYNFTFYDVRGEEIPTENIILANVSGDTNKTFAFNCDNCSRVYLKINKNNIIYQTDLIPLFPGQPVYKEIAFPTTLSQIQTTTEFLGLFDETGTLKINNIGFIGNNDLTKEYKLKFKTTFGLDNQEVLKKSFIKAGQYFTQNDDFIYLVNNNLFLPEDTELSAGCRYRGTITSWDNNYFNTNYRLDRSFAQCQTGKYKWVEFDFSDIEPNVIEYSINFKFKNEITNPDNYKIYFRSINSNHENFSFFPTLANWQNWTIRPEGYFYAPAQTQSIPFDNTNYSYNLKLSDNAGDLNKFGSDYILQFNRDYNYSLDFIQFRDNNRTGDIITNTVNTTDNLVFKKSYFKDKVNATMQILNLDNNLSVTIPQKTTHRGYYFTNHLIKTPKGFFSLSGQPQLKTQLFKTSQNSILETISTNILAYAPNDYVPEIKSQAVDGNIYIGLNDINISLKNKTGQFQNGIAVKYIISEETTPTELGVITNNYLNTQIFIPDSASGKLITFTYTIPNSNLPNNELEKQMHIGSGIEIYNTNNQLITEQNKLPFYVIITNLNGTKKTSDPINNYIIKNKTNRSSRIESISITETDGLLVENTNQVILTNNQLPKTLTSETNIQAKVLVDENTTNTNIDFNYNNLFTLQNTGNTTPTTIYRSTKSNATVKSLTITDNSSYTTEQGNGFFRDTNGSKVELITDFVTSFTLSYHLNLLFNNPDNYNILEITTTGDNLANTINFSQANIVTSQADRVVGNLNFVFTLLNNQINVITERNITLNVKIGNQRESFNYEIPLKIIIYPKNKTYELTTQGTQINIPCKSNLDCKLNKLYTIKNNTNSYTLNLTSVQMPSAPPLSITPIPLTPITNTSISVNVDGNFADLMSSQETNKIYTKSLIFDLTINNNTIQETRNLIVQVTFVPEDAQIALTENGLNGNFCLGVGGQITNTDQFILGACNFDEPKLCLTGEEALPKVLYNWGQTTVNWNNLCIDNNLDYDFNKTHCDSVQALYSIFTLIGDSTRYRPQDQNYYVYLMSDGISEDLLNDFRSRYNQFLTHNINQAFQDAYLKENYLYGLEIYKKNIDGTPTRKVGKYKLTVDNYSSNFANDITINLLLVQSIPLNKDSLFYYIPFDGDFGLKPDGTVHRIGYGSTIVGSYDYSELIPVILSETGRSVNLYKKANCPGDDCGGVAQITANYPTNYLIDWQVQDVLNSNGLLFDLAIIGSNTEKTDITLNFIPSRPIHLYAKVNDINNTNFNYQFKYSDTDFFTWNSSIIDWKDYQDTSYDSNIADTAIFGLYNTYLRHSLTKDKFVSKYSTTPLSSKYLLESKIYLPVSSRYNNLKISTLNLNNHENSRFYGLDNTAGSREMLIKSIVTDTRAITDLFNQIRAGNACISKSLSSTKIEWVENKTSLPLGTRNLIINNFSNTE